MSEFQKIYVRRPGNRKHSFFITWIIYQLTSVCSSYAIQLKQMSGICKVFKNLVIKMWFPFNFAKNWKDPHFVVGGSKTLKLSPNTYFGVSFQKNLLSSFLLFLSVCYQDDLSDSEKNEIKSSTARNFNNSWLLYVKFSETIHLNKYLTDRKLKMWDVFIFEIKGAKKNKISNF